MKGTRRGEVRGSNCPSGGGIHSRRLKRATRSSTTRREAMLDQQRFFGGSNKKESIRCQQPAQGLEGALSSCRIEVNQQVSTKDEIVRRALAKCFVQNI